jgi:AraC family transcriptional regulator
MSSGAEALGVALTHELRPARGAGFEKRLAGWQKKRVANHIEEHLHEDISLKELAGIAQLSPYHFARAFKQPFGTPRHRYHMSLRMNRAKAM